MRRVLVLDDEDKLRNLLARLIQYEGFEVIQARDCKTAENQFGIHDIDVFLCDVKLEDGNGIDFSGKMKIKYPWIEIILLTAYGNIPDSVQAIKNGAFDYITKGDDNNKIIPLIHKAIEKVELTKRVINLEKQLSKKYSFDSIIGTSKKITEAKNLALTVSKTDATVLINGETGTGKEVFAQAIHYNSLRSGKSFVAINCAAISKDLLESELFGHIAGAFTGALRDQKGLFKEADNGTIFLDEIAEMSVDLQAKLLRVIETGEFFKIGETKTTKTNIRIIAATNKNLEKCIENGTFREDLYYRLAGFKILLPPLRERQGDIELFVSTFAEAAAVKSKKKISEIPAEYFKILCSYNWPGNIRELKNTIERSVILMDGNSLSISTLPSEIFNKGAEASIGTLSLSFAEKSHIQKVLSITNGNKAETARVLNIALTTLYRKITEYGLE